VLIFQPGSAVLDYDTPEDIFLIKPYVPMFSTLIMHGMPSTGKTPIGWAMCEAIQTGTSFLGGPPAQQGNAVFIEFDMPLVLVKDRWKHATPIYKPSFGAIFLQGGVNTLALRGGGTDNRHKKIRDELGAYNEKYKPSFVLIDALRECIEGDLNLTGIADLVYETWHHIFPHATNAFLHHENKDEGAGGVGKPGMQRAKGSFEFVDIAQVSMRLTQVNKDTSEFTIQKTQASAKPDARFIRVLGDGVHLQEVQKK